MKRLLPLLLLLLVTACGAAVGIKPHVAVGAGTLVDRLTILAGTAGTATAATGTYLTFCSATSTATNATVTITPCGPSIATCTAQTAIPIPSGVPWTMAFTQSPTVMGDASTCVFANTSAYFCQAWTYSP